VELGAEEKYRHSKYRGGSLGTGLRWKRKQGGGKGIFLELSAGDCTLSWVVFSSRDALECDLQVSLEVNHQRYMSRYQYGRKAYLLLLRLASLP